MTICGVVYMTRQFFVRHSIEAVIWLPLLASDSARCQCRHHFSANSGGAAIIPLAAVPVSLIGTFTIMLAFGFSINALSLFGLVLAIGIVVDDAIVVIENVEAEISRACKVVVHSTRPNRP